MSGGAPPRRAASTRQRVARRSLRPSVVAQLTIRPTPSSAADTPSPVTRFPVAHWRSFPLSTPVACASPTLHARRLNTRTGRPCSLKACTTALPNVPVPPVTSTGAVPLTCHTSPYADVRPATPCNGLRDVVQAMVLRGAARSASAPPRVTRQRRACAAPAAAAEGGKATPETSAPPGRSATCSPSASEGGQEGAVPQKYRARHGGSPRRAWRSLRWPSPHVRAPHSTIPKLRCQKCAAADPTVTARADGTAAHASRARRGRRPSVGALSQAGFSRRSPASGTHPRA